MFSHYLARCKHSLADVNARKGFSLVELLVSISILTIILTVILTRQGAFNGAVLLRAQTYEIALQMREIQLNAVGANTDGSENFRSVLGMHFNSSDGSNQQFRIFRDGQGAGNLDGFYTDADEQFGRQGVLDSRFEIREIRSVGGDAISGNQLSVIFVRPNFDARFFDGPGASGEVNTPIIEIDIARRGETGTGVDVVRTLEVTATGQIAVQ